MPRPSLSTLRLAAFFGPAVIATFTVSAAPPPTLPTKCGPGSSCGSAATSFLQFGSATAAMSGSTTLNVTQTTTQAIVNWANFNIAHGFTVNFIQPSATAAILNNIWSVNPSIIAGQMKANGQVYLYNQNGIVFANGAQINVAGLTASTLPFAPVASSTDPDALFENGILSQNTAGEQPPAAFVAPATGTAGTVTVNSGATLTAADGGRIMLLGSAVSNSGTISTPDGQTILAAASGSGPNTPAVYLAASTDPSMRGLLIEVNGGGVSGTGTNSPNTVTNAGQITAARGNITLAGLVVNQEGMLTATTSVSANGSIYLLAGDVSGSPPSFIASPKEPLTGDSTAFGGLSPTDGGTLLLTPGSVTQVLPDTTGNGTLTEPQQASFIPSQVDLAGRVIALDGNASIHAPGGLVNVYASPDPEQLIGSGGTGTQAAGGSVYLDTDSSIDVSGLKNVSVPVTQNIVQVTLETDDLQNDPLQRNGFLHGATVTVNINDPPTLFSVTPYAQNIGEGIDQVLTKAGTISLEATGDVIARAGSTLNVSGGSIAYQSGYGPSTTNLIGANGVVYNISTAPSDVPYVGIAGNYSYTDPTWGTTVSGSSQTYYAGYLQGANAGTINIDSPAAYLRGTLSAQTVDGPYQRLAASPAGSLTGLPAGGTLIVGCSTCIDNTGLPSYGLDGGITFANNLSDTLTGNVVVDGYVVSSVNVPALTELSPAQLAQGGFNTINVSSNGAITVPAGVNVSLAANGSFIAQSAAQSALSINIDGQINAPGGSVSLTTVATAGSNLAHDITLGAGAVIDVSGGWTNDSPSVTVLPGTAPVVIDGGSVSASAAGNIVLGAGSRIDVSGGGWMNQSSQLSEGSAGTISLAANLLATQGSVASVTNPYVGTIDFGAGATLIGASLKAGDGGTLALQSGSVTVGTTAAGTPGELLLAPGFFEQGGFAQYVITGQNDVIIGNLMDTADTAPITVKPIQQNLVFTKNAALQPTGTNLADFTQLETLLPSQRQPASVDFIATANDPNGAQTGSVTLLGDASIVTDPGASIELAASGFNGDVLAFGSILAPAGNITLQIESTTANPIGNTVPSSDPVGYIPNQQIELGPDAVLAAPAYALINTLDPLGYPEGSVLAGGTVTLLANKGYVVTDPGSVVNVSGTVGTIDIVQTNGVTPTTVAGNAGTINISAREGIVLQGSLLGQAASLNGSPVSGAAGGTLNVGLGNSNLAANTYNDSGSNATGLPGGSGTAFPTTTRTLTVAGVGANGQPAVPPSNQLLSGTAVINVGTIEAGGFDNVALYSEDTIAFTGTVALQASASLTLDAPLFVANHGAQVNLTSPYVAVGNLLNNPDYFDFATNAASPNATAVLNPTGGTGTLAVNAQLIDIRGISGWSGFATENFASTGDIRLVDGANQLAEPPALQPSSAPPLPSSINVSQNPGFEGEFNTSAAVTLQGAQIYPTTATTFAINDLPGTQASQVSPTAATVTVAQAPGATSATPLSAGGTLIINATNIIQNGTLRAPLGQIALNGIPISDAAGNATPGTGMVTLSSTSLTSVSADGLTIPYGETSNGTEWTYSPSSIVTNVISAPPSKQISLNGSSVTVNGQVDLAGGGDLYAYEFVAGEGGSVDVLDQASLTNSARAPGTTVFSYAIVPGLGSSFAPIDPQYAQSSSVGPNQTIYLSGVPGLPAGTYALLPAHYALLPGAFAVQVVQSDSGIVAGSAVAQPNGSYVVAGRFGIAGTSTLDSLTSTVDVASNATVNTLSQYTNTYANAFFSSAAATAGTTAPSLPADAGQLLLSASNNLALNGAAGSINFARGSFASTNAAGQPITVQGLGGDVSITAPSIEVVDAVTAPSASATAGTVPAPLQLSAQQLDNLDAQTLILGATSSNTSAGEQLTLGPTQTVELANKATALTGPDIILAAQDSVMVDAGAQITASGTGAQMPSTLVLPTGGALLRVSSAAPAALVAGTNTGTSESPLYSGTVSIGAGATVQSSGSLLLYGSNTTTLDPTAQVSSPAVALYSSQVSLGDVPTGAAAPPGLNLTAQLLGGFQGLTNLTIGSTSTIDFYGNVTLGTAATVAPTLQSITLDAGGLRGYGTADDTVLLHAGSVTLTNSGAAAPPTDGTGTGTLQILAGAINDQAGSGQITLGAGTKIVSGFSAVNLQAAGDIVGQGTGTLQVDGNAVPVTLTSAALVGAAGATQTITTAGAVTINPSSPGNLALTAPGPGAAFTILAGGNIQQNGSIDLPSGIITLTAGNGSATAGSGNVTLGTGSVTSVAGATQSYTVADAVAAGGQISLSANTGNVVIDGGATVDVSGASASVSGSTVSSDAGSLSVSAPQGTFSFAAGSILKGGAAAGQQQGSFTLDESYGLGDSCPAGDACLAGAGFAPLAAMLSSGGFTGAIDLRTRTDTSVTIAGTVQASSFELSADQGSITVAGTGVIDTSGRSSGLETDGGPIDLWAGNSLTLQSGAKLLANAGSAGPVGAGGTALASPGGDITLGISCNDGIACGTVDLQPGSIIDLQGSAAGSDGTLTVRAPVIAAPTNGIYTAPNGATGAAMSGPVDVAITEIGSTVMGQNPVIVEGYNVYQLAASGVLSQTNPDALANPADANGPYTTLSIGMGGVLFANANNLIQNSAAISRLEGTEAPGGPALQLRPGIEVQGAGDLQVGDPGSTAETWDLDSWNAALGGVPVNLTLRAAGNLIFNASLSDGFQNTNSNVTDWTFGESAANPDGASGSYRLVAGADLTAANPLAVVVQTAAALNLNAPASGLGAPPNSGNFILTPGSSTTTSNLIRTGTGSIDIAAGGDVLLGYSVDSDSGGVLQVTESDPLNAVIYTAGVPSPVAPTSLFTPPSIGKKSTVSYPIDGGNITVFGGDDIRSATSAQLVSNWLGRADPTAGSTQNTTWWIEFNNFDQGIGVLGGGNLSLTAGRDIVNTSAVVPTTGRVLLAAGGTPVAADLDVMGGGTLRVQAGGDIVSGVFEDDWGNASISAGGALTSSGDSTYGQITAGLGTQQIITETPSFNATELYPILVVGNGVFDVSARSSIALDGITNSTTLPIVSTQVGSNAAFFPYAPTSNPSTLNLVSAGGDVDLNNDPAASLPIAQLSNLGIVYNRASADADDYLAVYPSTLNVASLSGNINLGDAITLFPSATGNLTLLAAGSINSANGAVGTASSVSITVSESNPALVPNPLVPVNDVGADGFPGVTGVVLPAEPLHQNDAQPIMLVADTGNIDSAVLNFPKAADVIAGGNIMDLMYTGKNLNPSDVTLIEAGGQVEYSTPTVAGTNALEPNTAGITLAGPGYLEVLAGGAVNLGDGNGIVTSGALSDVRLPTAGATVVVGAGLGTNADGSLRQPDNQAFIQSYLDPNATTGAPSAYAADLIGYMQQLYPASDANLNYPAALSAFNALTPAQQLPLLSQVLSDELSATGLAHTLHGASYAPGFTAIDTLFPTTSTVQGVTTPLTYSGDLDLFFSQVKTEQGGDIDLLVPGGSVIAGVANPPATLGTVKQTPQVIGPPIPAAANLGLLVLGQGAIQGFADENFTVDTSRILTLEGGNIILWASNGDIDAGAGAKSASAAPPPIIETNSQGDTFVNPSNSVVGSGIGQLLSGPGETAGLVNLIAPNGDVNAGDAGIRVAGNLNIAAVQVIGAANITVVGTSTGVPVSEAGAFAGALSGANSIGDASKNAVAALTSDIGNSANYQQMTDSLQPSFIVVKMFCLGVECETH